MAAGLFSVIVCNPSVLVCSQCQQAWSSSGFHFRGWKSSQCFSERSFSFQEPRGILFHHDSRPDPINKECHVRPYIGSELSTKFKANNSQSIRNLDTAIELELQTFCPLCPPTESIHFRQFRTIDCFPEISGQSQVGGICDRHEWSQFIPKKEQCYRDKMINIFRKHNERIYVNLRDILCLFSFVIKLFCACVCNKCVNCWYKKPSLGSN